LLFSEWRESCWYLEMKSVDSFPGNVE
jgi:hypothetical protein